MYISFGFLPSKKFQQKMETCWEVEKILDEILLGAEIKAQKNTC